MIYKKWQKYSYTAQRHQRHRLLVALLWILGTFLLYLFISSFFIFSFYVESDSMAKTLTPGDVGLALSTRLFPHDKESSLFPYKHGDLIVLEKSYSTTSSSWYVRLWDNFIAFFTAQRAVHVNEARRLFIKRIIALPGDEISITDNIVRVKQVNQDYNLTEFELSSKTYDITVPNEEGGAGNTLPFASNMALIRLKEGECFVLSDDRSDCNDSRTWGPVTLSDIKGKPFFRYWPFSRIGKL
ncbi:signal peptidase I [Gracilinema caldarium]|uniref:Signal peptidase I n=1 Tax=Gracilinema caldarium (strain ATCC 51460 / DSM 7334 / H1) TaxID=744872 RepID=F8F2Q3_GRAC1|nr:signal peptidase I [Gracilinema caldarium]AEJ19447.1 signal peptidase I [Gracilinema caldarium DSM 7334]